MEKTRNVNAEKTCAMTYIMWNAECKEMIVVSIKAAIKQLCSVTHKTIAMSVLMHVNVYSGTTPSTFWGSKLSSVTLPNYNRYPAKTIST